LENSIAESQGLTAVFVFERQAAEESTRRVWDYFNGTRMPNSFFPNSGVTSFTCSCPRGIEMTTARIAIGLFCGFVASGLTWLIADESSPFYRFFLFNESIADIWRLLNLPVMMVLLITRIDYRPFALFLIFLQWLLIGCFASWLAGRIKLSLRAR
jgi:hypothetical protein